MWNRAVRQAVNFWKRAFILVKLKLSISRVASDKYESSPSLRVGLNKSWHRLI